ncbi:MAG: hypothetical protein ACK5XN_00255 [Bacteroidota bacterium]|jgi:hypothetical protein
MTTTPIGTADGMLTRATPQIPPGSRARSITVTAKNYTDMRRIVVSVSPSTILTFEYRHNSTILPNDDTHGLIRLTVPNVRKDKLRWHGWSWKLIDSSTWYQTPFKVSAQDAVSALTAEDAVVEHLRYILNDELRIRPVISSMVCDAVTNAIRTKTEVRQTFRGVRAKVSTESSSRE